METEQIAVLLVLAAIGTYAISGIAATGEAAQPDILDIYYGPYFEKSSPGYEYPAMIPPETSQRAEWIEVARTTTPSIDIYYNKAAEKDVIITIPNYPEKNTNFGK